MMPKSMVDECHSCPALRRNNVIGEKERYHGLAFARLIQNSGVKLMIEAQGGKSRCAYVLNDEIALFVKYSTNLLSPWPFVFSPEQRREINHLSNRFPKVWLVLICGHEGIATVKWKEATENLVPREEAGGFSLQASRKPSQNFRISGSREKPILVSDSNFPRKILDG